MIEVVGKGGITVRIIADSVSSVNEKRITTIEAEYPRFIHSEVMTHRQFSRNAASSRAIPVEKMLELVRQSPAIPIHWGKNQSGMQAKKECDAPVLTYNDGYDEVVLYREKAWSQAAHDASTWAELFSEAGYHKQIVNRLLEPFQMMKTVITATEWDNFFWLRKHPDAQPEIAELARCVWEAMQQSTPEVLHPGEWHTPYVEHSREEEGLRYVVYGPEGYGYFTSLENALKISASCCAQVSYRKADDSLEKALVIYDRLVESKPVHASPFEHQATPVKYRDAFAYRVSESDFENGITSLDRGGSLWSGNFKSWIQHRQLIPDNVCTEYKENING